MKLVIDMNLSPAWAEVLAVAGCDAVHWSDIGDPRAPDSEIMSWARENRHVVLTHDLDFGTLLACTRADGPSVVQVRAQNVSPSHLGLFVLSVLRDNERMLDAGALVVMDEASARVRILPLNPE